MAATQGPFLAAVLLLVSSGLLCSSPLPACPEPCTCQRAPLLNCSSSGLSSVPQSIQGSVTELDLSHNLLDSVALSRPYHHLRNVWLGNNSITRLSLCIERNLVGRDVRGRHLHRLRPWSRGGCVSWAPTLQLLSVERNQLEQLPEGLEGSESLQVLQLSFNRISTLRPGDLSHLQQLMELHLQHNLITSLHPQMFQDLAQLRVLDLSFNMLTSLHPLTYLSLRNIGVDVRIGGNRWNCDCSMHSLRRRMAYDSSRGLQPWSMVCASPSVLKDRDLLQLEEDDLNCSSTQNGPETHQDVTVYRGSEILLSCSSQDSMWWTPHGQESVHQPQAGLLINDITERDTGLYVCVSEENKVVSVFNLQISKIGGARRKARSLTRTSREIIPQGTPNRIGQQRNQAATQSELVLAVCLSVFITFLVAFILGVFARPCIDVLWRRVTKKKSSPEANSASTAGQRQYDNEGYSDGDEPEEIGTYRERRVTYTKNSNVQYYTTERVARTAGNSGSEDSLQPSTSEENQQAGKDLSGVTGRKHNIKFEHIPDPVELEKRRSLSSCSDSSVYDKGFNEDQMIQRNHKTPKFPQLAEDSVQQAEVPQISIESREIPGFSSEPFADWSPHTKNTNITDPDLQQENEEQFEFSDSVRSISARSSSVFGSFKDSKLVVAATSDKQKGVDTSSSSSCTSGHEPTDYTVNSDQEREEDIERNHNKPEISNAFLNQDDTFQLQIHGVNPILPSVAVGAVRSKHSFSSSSSDSDGEDQKETEGKDKSIRVSDKLSSRIVTEEPDTRRKVQPMPRTKWRIPSLGVTTTSHSESLDTRAPSLPAANSSSSSSESEVDTINLKVEQNTGRVNEGIKINEPERLSTDLDHKDIPQIKSCMDINAQLPASDSTSSDESTDETTKHTKRQVQGGKHMAGIPTKDYQSVSNDPMKPQWPSLDFGNVTPIKRRLDVRAPSTAADSSSSSESADETMDKTQKHRETQVTSLQFKESQPVSQQWPVLDLEHTTHVKRRLDIQAPSPPSDSSSSSDSEDGQTGHAEAQEQGQMHMVIPPITASHKPQTQWPVLDLGHTTHVKRRLDIQAPSPPSDSSSSSDSEDEITNHLKKQEKGKTQVTRPAIKVSQTVNHDTNTQRPARDLEHTTYLKSHPDSSSSSDSEDGPTGHTETQEQGQMHMVIPPITASTTHIKRRLDIQAPSTPSDSSSSSDSEDEITNHLKKQEKGKTQMTRPAIKVSQTVNHDTNTQRPARDLEHTTHIKRHPDSSSSSDSEDGQTGHAEAQEQGQMHMVIPPITASHKPQTQWPVLDLGHTTHVKRRLDIQAPSPPSDSSSSSDSEDGPTGHTETQEQGQMHMVIPPITASTTHVKRRLDIQAPSTPSDSSSSSDSEDEITNHLKKQEKGKTQMTRPAIKVSQTVNHDTNTQRPARDLEHTTYLKRHPDSSSSSDSEDGPTSHTETEEQGQMHMVIPPITASTTHVKRHLDIQAPSTPSDSSSSSDSEDEPTGHTEKQRPSKVGIPFQKSQTESHDSDTRWPALDITGSKRHLDIKASSPVSDSSSSSDSEDETTNHIKQQEQGETYKARLPNNVSQTGNDDPQRKWPLVDLEHTTHLKSHPVIKPPSPASDSLSSSDSEDEATHHTKERPELMGNAGPQSQESQTLSHDPETGWPAVDLGSITHIKRRLDIKAPSKYPDSLLSGGSTNHRVEGKREEAIKISPQYSSSSSSDEQEGGMKNLRNSPTTVEPDPDSRWLQPDLSGALRVKRHLDIRVRSPPPESSSSSNESEGGTTDLALKVERDRADGGMSNYQLGTKLPPLNMSIPLVKRRLNIKAPVQQASNNESSQQVGSNSSGSDSEDENRDHAKTGLRAPAISKASEKDFIRSPLIHTSLSSQTDHNIKLKKYTVITDDTGDKRTSDNINTTPNIKPELESRWAMMGLGISRFRKRLEITSDKHEPINLPSSPAPESSSSSSSENGTGSKRSRTRRKRRGAGKQDKEPSQIHTSLYVSQGGNEKSDSVWPHLSLTNPPNIRKAVDTRAPLQREASSSSSSENETVDHSVPGLSLGVPHVERHLYDKPPLPESSTSSFSSSENENEVTEHTTRPSRHASDMTGMADNDSLLTYKRTIFKPSLPPRNSFSQSGPTIDQRNQRQRSAEMVTAAQKGPSLSVGGSDESLAPRLASISFDDVVKRRAKQFTGTTNVDLPPEIRWTGVGHQLSDLSISGPRRNLDVGLSIPQQASPAEPQLPPFDSSNQKIKPDRGNTDGTVTHKYSSLGANSVSLVSSRGLDKFDNSLSSTNERAVPEDRRERRGLSALKAMSSERQKWDTPADQVDASFNNRRSEDIKPLAQSHVSSTAVDEREANLLYGIPHYRRHDIGGTEPLQEAPPPIPATPLPDEAVELTWRSPQSSKKQGLEGTRSYLRQSRNTDESEPSSVTSQNQAAYF